MRVLLPVYAFPPRSTAGVEVYTLRLAQALAALGHEVLVLSAVHDLAAAPGAVRRRRHAGVEVAEVVNVHHRGTLNATYDDPDVDQAGAAVMAEFQPTVVHFQHLLNLSIGLVAVARRHGAVVLLTLHDYWLSCPRDGLRMQEDLTLCATMDHTRCATCLRDSPYLVPDLQRGLAQTARRSGLGRHLHRVHAAFPHATERLLRLLRRLRPPDTRGLAAAMDARAGQLRGALLGIDRILAPTAFACTKALEFGIPATRLEQQKLGALVTPARPRRAGARPRLGFVGTLAPHKGLHVLLRAFRAHAPSGCTLDVFGSLTAQPGYVETLRSETADDARIRWRGGFAEGEQGPVLEALDALVAPSVWWENSPLTVIEALAAGRPVIATRTGGVPELVEDGRTGLLVAPGDAAALGCALRDVALGHRLGEPLPPLPLLSAAAGAEALIALYARLREARPLGG